MIVGIDIRVLGAKGKTGIQEYTENLLAALLPLDPSIEFKLFYSSYKIPLPGYSWLELPNVRVHQFRLPNRLLLYASRAFNYPKLDRWMGGVDVFFSPHFLITALSPSVRRVTAFHDLSFEQFPEFFSRKQWMWHRFVSPAWQARFSDQIISVSESTKHDLVKHYHIDPSRIMPVHSGVNSQFRLLPLSEIQEFRDRHQLPSRFILYFGTFEPRKNIRGLIQAFTAFKKIPGNETVELVLAGASGWLDAEIYSEAKKSSASPYIHIRNNIAENDRVGFYNAASVFIYPSFFEGFGFPALEAMASGTPVIASSTSSLPEVVGEAGMLVNPYNLSELTKAIHCVFHEEGLAQKMREKGLERAQKFTWEQTARKTLDILTRL
jgi:glycosyltransferase involved in cell wall biosynthesis